MTQHCCAMVFAHPGHELLAMGLLQRHRPHLLFLTRANSGGDFGREELSLYGLRKLGLAERATFLGVDERDIFRWLLEGQATPFLDLRNRLLEWLHAVRPTQIFGDAFELTNVVHDIGRALLDSAWRQYRRESSPCDNFELPLVCRTEPEPWKLRFQEFPCGPFETFALSDAELEFKRALADWVGTRRVEAAMARSLFLLEREVFRSVTPDRSYSAPPPELRFHYDDWGRYQVQNGKYARPILFADHFVPMIRQLPWLA